MINVQWLCFILLTFYAARDTFSKLTSRSKPMSYDEVWILTVICGVFVIWASYYTAKYTSYISGALSFSFIFYLSLMVIFYERNKIFNFSIPKKESYTNKIEENVAHNTLLNITTVFEERKIYKRPDLTLSLLAKELSVRPQFLSQLLNDNLNKSFNQFINEYRVEEAKRLLKEDAHLKIDAVGIECGFNSSSTFYSTFKKVTGTTPSNYVKT
jgi:AraC-like DNA-binding protein